MKVPSPRSPWICNGSTGSATPVTRKATNTTPTIGTSSFIVGATPWGRSRLPDCSLSFLLCRGSQERLDRAALVHGPVALRRILERKREVEDLPRIDLPAEHELDELGQVAPHRGGSTVQVHLREEQLLAVEVDAVGDADETDVPAGPGGADRLPHRFLRPDTLEHGVGADTFGQILDPQNTVLAALAHDVGRPELAADLLPALVPAHRDDPLRAHQLCRQDAEKADRAVAHDDHRLPGPYLGRIGGEPARAHHVGERKETGDQLRRGNFPCGDQGAVRERNAEPARLRAAHQFAMLAGRLVAGPADRTGVVGGEERPDHELAGPHRADRASHLFDDPAVLVADRSRLLDLADPAVRPQVGSADAGSGHPDDRIRSLRDPRLVAVLDPDVARRVQNGSSHRLSPFSWENARERGRAPDEIGRWAVKLRLTIALAESSRAEREHGPVRATSGVRRGGAPP